MDIVTNSKILGGLTVQTSEGGEISALHAGVVVNVDYNFGSSASLSTSIDAWPLLNQRQQAQMGSIYERIIRAVEEL